MKELTIFWRSPPSPKEGYVDDICTDTLVDLMATALQLVDLCTAGGFLLAKWQSNHLELFETISPDKVSTDSHPFEESPKILEFSWQPQKDQFIIFTHASPRVQVTKQFILSEVAQLFDLLGFLSLVIIRTKILLQEL